VFRALASSSGPRAHLQTEGRNDRLVVADPVAHVTGVLVLTDQERILIQTAVGRSRRLLVVVLRRRGFGFDAPEDPIGPGRFPLLATEQKSKATFLMLTEYVTFPTILETHTCSAGLYTYGVNILRCKQHMHYAGTSEGGSCQGQ